MAVVLSCLCLHDFVVMIATCLMLGLQLDDLLWLPMYIMKVGSLLICNISSFCLVLESDADAYLGDNKSRMIIPRFLRN